MIGAIRAIDSANLILVGNPSWDQRPSAAIGSTKLSAYKNLAYTLHFYAGTHTDGLRYEGESAMEGGLALFISFFPHLVAGLQSRGYKDADIRKILGGNLLRAWGAIEDGAGK